MRLTMIGETRLTRKLKNGGEGISSGIDRSENKSTTRRGKAPSVWTERRVIYWQEPWLFASIMQNPDTISRRESPTRGWPKSMVERNRWPGAQQSSITIGNKSKADATGCLRGNLSPLSPRRFFSPPADNTTVFNKYKTIHETVSTPFHFIYIYISLGTLLEFLEALWISPIFKRFSNWSLEMNSFLDSNTPRWE